MDVTSLDQARALVLNADFRPLRIAPVSTYSWQDAVSAALSDRVNVLAEYDLEVHAQEFSMRVPSVISLRDYVDLDRPAAVTRQNMYAYYGPFCAFCGDRFSTSELTIDHVIPKSRFSIEKRHEANHPENLVLACVSCNGRKGARTPQEARMRLRITPRQPTIAEINAKAMQFLKKDVMPKNWLDWLYWTVELES
jgi:5-methylcytosine-specific restriction endonuclease McrA